MSYPNSHHNVNGRLRTTQLASSAYALSHRAALWMLIRSCLRVRGSYVLQCHQEHWISRHWTTAARGCMGFEFCQPLVTAFWSNDQIFLPSAPLLLRSPLWLWSFPLRHPLSPPMKGLPSVWKPFLLHSSLPLVQVPSLFFCLCFFFFLLPYPGTWGVSCLLGGLRSSSSVQ